MNGPTASLDTGGCYPHRFARSALTSRQRRDPRLADHDPQHAPASHLRDGVELPDGDPALAAGKLDEVRKPLAASPSRSLAVTR
jgi:hypothetical protein